MLIAASQPVYELDLSRGWFALSGGISLPLIDGSTCRLLYTGFPGGACGPDISDAILAFSALELVTGDIEFHVRASDWYAHGHDVDARYNNVILHVTLVCDSAMPIRRQDGALVPMCSLYDLPLTALPHPAPPDCAWPCHSVMQGMSDEECSRVLRLAGLLRFEQKTHAFVEWLHNAQPLELFTVYDSCLLEAIAEGLGYGRNRAFFRAAGQYLMGLATTSSVPEPLGHTALPGHVDAGRLAFLRALIEGARSHSLWQRCQAILQRAEACSSTPDAAYSLVHELRAIFAAIGAARADILMCNVVLPFAAAVALLEQQDTLGERAQQLYRDYPALSSNRITRAMRQQLQLASEPGRACQQQGLHYIYQQTCREKRCAMCIVGARRL